MSVVEKDALADLDGGLRGTVADAMTFARECAEDWGTPVVARVRDRREDLPPIIAHRTDHDGPTWTIRPRITPPDVSNPPLAPLTTNETREDT